MPAYREEPLIAKIITTMPDLVDHIVVVDDCSPDGTSDGARRRRPPGHPHSAPGQQGRRRLHLDGHKKALELGADVNVVMAGDAQMDPAYLPDLLDPIATDGYEFTKANRFFSRPSLAGMPSIRLFGNIMLSFMTKVRQRLLEPLRPAERLHGDPAHALERLDARPRSPAATPSRTIC